MKEIEKYPRDFQEFLAQFTDEKACWQYLIDIRWTDGYVYRGNLFYRLMQQAVTTAPMSNTDIKNTGNNLHVNF